MKWVSLILLFCSQLIKESLMWLLLYFYKFLNIVTKKKTRLGRGLFCKVSLHNWLLRFCKCLRKMNSLKVNKRVCFETFETKLYSTNLFIRTCEDAVVLGVKRKSGICDLRSSYLLNTERVIACCQLMDSFKHLSLNYYSFWCFKLCTFTVNNSLCQDQTWICHMMLPVVSICG